MKDAEIGVAKRWCRRLRIRYGIFDKRSTTLLNSSFIRGLKIQFYRPNDVHSFMLRINLTRHYQQFTPCSFLQARMLTTPLGCCP